MADKIFYLTRGKLQELKKEYQDLVDLEHRRSLSQERPKVLESEDLNPEFVSFQEDIGFLRARIDELRNVIDNHEIIKKPAKGTDSLVMVGSKVKVEVDGHRDEFVIVGTLEANPTAGLISNESPVGKALLGRKVGDQVEISSPVQTIYKIIGVKHEIN